MSAPAFGQLGTATSFSAVSSFNVSLPATVVNGEFAELIVGITDDVSSNVSITWPAGWTERSQDRVGSAFFYAGCAYKRLSSSEGGTSVTVTLNGGGTFSGHARIATSTGVRLTGAGFEGYGKKTGTTASLDSSAFTTTEGNELGVFLGCWGRNTVTSAPSGWTERMDSGGNVIRVIREDKVEASPTSEGVASVTIANDDWVSWTLAYLSQYVDAVLAATGGGGSAAAAATVEHDATLAATGGGGAAAATFTVEHSATFAATGGGGSAALAATVEHLAAFEAGSPKLDILDKTQMVALVEHDATLASSGGAGVAAAIATVEHLATFAADGGAGDASAIFLVNADALFIADGGAGVAIALFDVEHLAVFDAQGGAGVGSMIAGVASGTYPKKLERLAGPYSSVLDWSPRRRRAQVGDTVRVSIAVRDARGPIDVAAALLVELAFLLPSGASIVRRGEAGATLGRAEYQFGPGELAEAGDWRAQARVLLTGGGEAKSAELEFFVGWNLPTS
jgi:hypothetical protein